MHIRWYRILRIVAMLGMVVSGLWLLTNPAYDSLYTFLGAVTVLIVSFVGERASRPPSTVRSSDTVSYYPPTCGDRGLDLAQMRLDISTAFGAYFAGLLERDHNYVTLKDQVDVPGPTGQQGAAPIDQIYSALDRAAGPTMVVIAAEGGMGKSTLAAKIVRCLSEQQSIDMILGDSAKTQRVDPVTGEVQQISAGYYDLDSLWSRLCAQLGLPFQTGNARHALTDIRDRLDGRRAIIVVDNLETVDRKGELLQSLRKLLTRDVRVLVTTRTTSGLDNSSAGTLLVRLKPIRDLATARDFLDWHIQHYRSVHPDLDKVLPDLTDNQHLQRWLDRTGGIPLLMQLVISNVARFSWSYLKELPDLFGAALLDFLYESQWSELGGLGGQGVAARRLLKFVVNEQSRSKKITLDTLTQWARENHRIALLPDALRLLNERFLIVNHDLVRGNFAVFPSLSSFVQKQR